MNKFKIGILSAAAFLSVCNFVVAKENLSNRTAKLPSSSSGSGSSGNHILSGCTPSLAQTNMDINNVRTLIFINGDMWWDLQGTARYEIPKDSRKNSLFAGAIWIGGYDSSSGNLKVAAQTYRQSGSDFWPGPMDTTIIDVDPTECDNYDKHFKVTRQEVEEFRDYYNTVTNQGGSIDPDLVPEVIKEWPGNGSPAKNQGHFLAPFFDNDNDGIYDYQAGDYPGYDLGIIPNCGEVLLGDQTLWWVFNDVGNIHTETNGLAVGLEVRAQAFAFATNDEINNMTFYKFQIINRTPSPLVETYFGAWVDPDLGNYSDDYVGCDVARGFGYCYNGDAVDEGLLGYGTNPPAVGYDFFEGPIADAGDGKDNDRDGTVDEAGEKIIMSKFVYYNNDFTDIGNPIDATDYYNYLKGIWKDGTKMTYGGNGHLSGGDSCDFMFPGDTDPTGWGTGGVPQNPWDEASVGNIPADRRFIQSAGPFTLQGGAVNYITTGAVWARTSTGGPLVSVRLVRLADDKAQSLFDNCFSIVNGPDAPDVAIRELDRELILSLDNPPTSNNYKEEYQEKDPFIKTTTDTLYRFEGYKVYQLKDNTVSVTDLNNEDKAKLVIQCDIANGVALIQNRYFNPDKNAYDVVNEVLGKDQGLRHIFKITKDEYATGDDRLVNHKIYYYMAIAYGYNYAEDTIPNDGQGQPYKSGRRRIKTYTAIPHESDPEGGGMVLNSFFGDGPEITRIEGSGNGYNLNSGRLTLDLTQETVDEILQASSGYRSLHPTYKKARGPVDVGIYDPIKIQGGNFELWLTGVSSTDRWVLKNLDTQVTDTSDKTLEFPYDQLFTDYGMYVSINQVSGPGIDLTGGNGYIESTVEYQDPSHRWLSGFPDDDEVDDLNWILSGKNSTAEPFDNEELDPQQTYENIHGGTWSPYSLTADPGAGNTSPVGPMIHESAGTPVTSRFTKISSIDLVITSDKSKWSKCPVVELQNDPAAAIGNAKRGGLRQSPSLDINGNTISGSVGMSYFPGYAIDIETGERLNIAFGENSFDFQNNGHDMKWNPTDNYVSQTFSLSPGGQHVVYIFGHYGDLATDVPRYDEAVYLESKLSNPTNSNLLRVWKDCMWVYYSMLAFGEDFQSNLNSNEVHFRIRLTKPYAAFSTGVPDAPLINNNTLPHYTFNLNNLSPTRNSAERAKSALDLINVVPNPYYAFSEYEGKSGVAGQLDNRIRFTNLPAKCTVTIYTVNGTVVRKLRRDVPIDNTAGTDDTQLNLETAMDWDLKNSAGIPIAGGVYIIHVDAPGIGEKTIKWFGVLRPIDLDSF